MAEKKIEKKIVFSWLWSYIGKYRLRLIISMIASFGVSGTDVAYAKLVQPLVDKVLALGNTRMMLWVPGFVIGLAVIKGFSRYIQEYYIRSAGQLVVQDIRNDLFSKTMSLSLGYYFRTTIGRLISSVLNDIGWIQEAASKVMIDLVKESTTLVGLVALAFYQDWHLAIVAFIILPLAFMPAKMIGNKIKSYSRRGQEAVGELTKSLEQAYSGIKVIKAFGTEAYEEQRFYSANQTFYNFMRKLIKYNAASSPVVEILASFGVGGVLWYGMHRVASGAITQGQLFSTMVAVVMLYMPARRLMRVNNNIQQALAAIERVMTVLKEEPEIKSPEEPISVSRLHGRIEFNQVFFSYGDEQVLKNFSLTIEQGQVVALVGPSGAGKSTVAALLNRLYDPQQGSIEIDGYDLRQLDLNALRSNLALVDQDSFLFNDSIANNISYGLEGMSAESLTEAIRQAHAEEFINQLPDGLETRIGDRGVRLSGGQRQRICIARALLRDAPILILDEATSALDTESEAMVQKALENLMQNRTTLVIAHRLSTIMHADKIVVLEAGMMVESGSHEELLASGKLYRRLYDMQFVNQKGNETSA